jgi:hypothetical protein
MQKTRECHLPVQVKMLRSESRIFKKVKSIEEIWFAVILTIAKNQLNSKLLSIFWNFQNKKNYCLLATNVSFICTQLQHRYKSLKLNAEYKNLQVKK